MAIQTDQKISAALRFIDAAGNQVSLADLRGDARAVVLFFMRAGNCMMCLRHVRTLAGLGLDSRGVRVVVVVPGTEANAVRVLRTAGDKVAVVSSTGAEAHLAVGLDKTLFFQHSGTMLVDAADTVRYRLTATLPAGSFNEAALKVAVDRL